MRKSRLLMSMSITLNGMFESVTLVLLVDCHLACLIRDFGSKHTLRLLCSHYFLWKHNRRRMDDLKETFGEHIMFRN